METTVNKTLSSSKIDPTQFDVTIASLLIGLGAEKYVDIFKKRNIGQQTLAVLTEEDLIKLGVDDAKVRQEILNAVKSLPVYQETEQISTSNLTPLEITEIMNNSSDHLYKIYLSIIANTLALKKKKEINNCLLSSDKYASDILLSTFDEMINLLRSMDVATEKEFKENKQKKNIEKKKIIVGSVGGVVIAVLAVFFVKSLKQI